MLAGVLDTLAACQSQDGVDVESLVCQDAGSPLNLPGFQLSPHHHEDIAVLALMAHPVLILIIADGRETDVYAQFSGLEEQFLHGQARFHLVHADKDTQ